MNPTEILTEVRDALSSVYGDRLRDVILFGSVARGDDNEDSDIDFLVLLEGPLEYGKELSRISGVVYPLSLRWGRCVSATPALPSDYEAGEYPLYRSAKRDGIRV
jgi:predicted nucleotidyltransferase